jgi:hypothetical protein
VSTVALEAACLILVEEISCEVGNPEQYQGILLTAGVGNYRIELFSFCVR